MNTEMIITIGLFILGILLIVKGGDFFVDAAAWIAEVSGIPKLIIGATIVSLATTLPEMLVSVMAATQGKVDMSIGNAVGSVTANLGLIMAISLICMPGTIRRRDYLPKSALMLASALVIVFCGFVGHVDVLICVFLLLIFVVFLYENVHSARNAETLARESGVWEETSPEQEIRRLEDEGLDHEAELLREALRKEKKPKLEHSVLVVNIAKFVFGAAGIVIGAQLLVDNGSELARIAGISERIIGVTVVAIGTSLPELVTTITAIAKKQSSLSVGNILGANILDLSLIMPLASIISGKNLPISPSSAAIDLPACLLVCCIAVVPSMIHEKFSRWQGFVLMAVYGVYVYITCTA